MYIKDEMFIFTVGIFYQGTLCVVFLQFFVCYGFVFIFQQFLKNVLAILQSVKAQEEGKVKHLQNQDSLANTTVSLKIAAFAF